MAVFGDRVFAEVRRPWDGPYYEWYTYLKRGLGYRHRGRKPRSEVSEETDPADTF